MAFLNFECRECGLRFETHKALNHHIVNNHVYKVPNEIGVKK